MAERTAAVAIGEFGWFDLSSSDAAASRQFYSQLFGWQADVVPDPNAGGYGFFRHDGKEVAGVGPVQQQGQPTAWLPYVLVADANATAAAIRANGGTLFMEPFDVMGQGIMSVAQDPAGAVFGIWQPGEHTGVELKDTPGSVVWIDSMSRDIERSKAFYPAVFGWEVTSWGQEGPEYWTLQQNGRGFAGLFPPMPGMPENTPSFWQIHFGVTDADAVVAKAKELGAQVLFGPDDVPTVGRIAAITDPQGASFGIIQQAPRG
jgi:predicted enzyme related to lactoylglutathione lyase